MSGEFLKATMRAAEKGEIPEKVSNKMLWALAIDAKKDRGAIKKRISKNELRAAGIGGVSGLIAAIAAIIAAL